jgi:hypothetical protein
MAIDRDLGRRSPPMRSPGTIDDRARDVAPDGVPFNFYDSGRMDPPSRRFPMPTPPRMPIPMPTPNPFPNPRMPMPMPMPMPSPGPRQPMPMPPPSIPPGMGPFRQDRFPDQMPRGRQGIMQAAAVDPSDYRTILKLIDAGLDPNDYIQAASMAYDDDDYGPFIPDSVIQMDMLDTEYDRPRDEFLFDRDRNLLNNNFLYSEMNRGGIASLLQ